MTGLGKAPITPGMAMADFLTSHDEGRARGISAIRPLREDARAGMRPAPLTSPAQSLDDEFRRRPARELCQPVIRLPSRTAKELHIEVPMNFVPVIFLTSSSIQKGWIFWACGRAA